MNTGEVIIILDIFFTTYTVINFTFDTETVKSHFNITIDVVNTQETVTITISKVNKAHQTGI